MNCLGAINENPVIANGALRRQPNYPFPKEALAYMVGAVALAILAAAAYISPIAAPYGILTTIGLLGGCLSAAASASLVVCL